MVRKKYHVRGSGGDTYTVACKLSDVEHDVSIIHTVAKPEYWKNLIQSVYNEHSEKVPGFIERTRNPIAFGMNQDFSYFSIITKIREEQASFINTYVMSTQTKTISIPLDLANTGKLSFLDEIHKDVEKVARDFLKFKMNQLQDEKERDYKKDFNEKYREYREKYSDLNSGILQDTMRWIKDRVKAHIQNCKDKHRLVKWPEIKHFPIPIRNQMSTIREDDRHHDMWFRFCRINFPLHICEFHQKVLDNTEKFGDSQIIKKDDGWYLQLVCHVKCDEIKDIDEAKALGVDLGIVQPIVCSDGKRIGNGSRTRHKQKEYQKKRSKQQSGNKDITSKQRRWIKDQNHKLSRKLVDYASSLGAEVLVLEDLEGQRLSNGYHRQYKWSFAELKTFVEYKAKLDGIEVIDVDPAYTSRTCNACGHEAVANRKTRSLFECSECGFRADADVNAAKNILDLSVQDGPPVNQAKG